MTTDGANKRVDTPIEDPQVSCRDHEFNFQIKQPLDNSQVHSHDLCKFLQNSEPPKVYKPLPKPPIPPAKPKRYSTGQDIQDNSTTSQNSIILSPEVPKKPEPLPKTDLQTTNSTKEVQQVVPTKFSKTDQENNEQKKITTTTTTTTGSSINQKSSSPSPKLRFSQGPPFKSIPPQKNVLPISQQAPTKVVRRPLPTPVVPPVNETPAQIVEILSQTNGKRMEIY